MCEVLQMRLHKFPVKCWACEKTYEQGEGKGYDIQLCWRCYFK